MAKATTKKNASNQSGGTFEQEQQAPTTTSNVDLESLVKKLEEQNAQLMQALLIARNTQSPSTSDFGPTYKLENIGGTAIAFSVTDPRTGQPIIVSLQRKGEYKMLLKVQIEEAYEKYGRLFERGKIAALDVVAPNANTIIDVAKFVDTLPFDQITTRIAEIDSVPKLWEIWNEIETRRFVATDASGSALLEKDGVDGAMRPLMNVVPLDPKLTAIEQLVSQRIAALTNTKPMMDA